MSDPFDYSDSSERENDDNGGTEESIRAELATVPFEQLLKVQKDTERQRATSSERRGTSGARRKMEKPTRAAKDAPVEVTSKRPVTRYMQVVSSIRRAPVRDPRFDSLSGSFNKGLFRASYGFLDDVRAADAKELEENVRSTEERLEEARAMSDDDGLVEELEGELREARRARSAFERQQRAAAAATAEEKKKREVRRAASEAIASGKRPYFMKRADMKRKDAVERYQQIRRERGAAGVEQVIAKRQKREYARDKKRGPGFRTREYPDDE